LYISQELKRAKQRGSYTKNTDNDEKKNEYGRHLYKKMLKYLNLRGTSLGVADIAKRIDATDIPLFCCYKPH